LKQWQYEITSGGRIRYVVDDDKRTVWLVYASPRHSKAQNAELHSFGPATGPGGCGSTVMMSAAADDPLRRRLERRDRMLVAVEGPGGRDQLGDYLQELLDEGISSEDLYEDLTEIHTLLPEDEQEVMLDMMDALTGWCAPSARLEPRRNRD
jgi:hypothetical protein